MKRKPKTRAVTEKRWGGLNPGSKHVSLSTTREYARLCSPAGRPPLVVTLTYEVPDDRGHAGRSA